MARAEAQNVADGEVLGAEIRNMLCGASWDEHIGYSENQHIYSTPDRRQGDTQHSRSSLDYMTYIALILYSWIGSMRTTELARIVFARMVARIIALSA